MKFLACIVFAIGLIVAAFHFAKPLPNTNFDESFLPKASTVRYIAAGNDASVAGLFWIKGLTELGESYLYGKEYGYLSHIANLCTNLDTLFYTPYYFVSGVTPIATEDTSDFEVMRRGHRVFPDDWRMAVHYALRLAKGPYPNKAEAGRVMRPYFDSPDSTIPPHIRMIYRTFELESMDVDVALELVMNDIMQPQFKKFRESFYMKTYRLLGLAKTMKDVKEEPAYIEIKRNIDGVVDGKIHPAVAYRNLLEMKKVEELKQTEIAEADTVAATELPADSAAADSLVH